MKKIIVFLTALSLLSPVTMLVNACDSGNSSGNDDINMHHAQEISAAISSNNSYSLNIKAGITKEYLMQQITPDFIKAPLAAMIQSKFIAKMFDITAITKDDSEKSPLTADDLTKPNSTINTTLHFCYYKKYGETTKLTINIEESLSPVDISNIEFTIPDTLNFWVFRLDIVTENDIEKNIFSKLRKMFIDAVAVQKNMVIKYVKDKEDEQDFALKWNKTPWDDYSKIKTKKIDFTFEAVNKKRITNCKTITVELAPFNGKKPLNSDINNYLPQSIDAKLGYETYNDIKVKIRRYVYQDIENLDNTALENQDYEIQFKNQHQEIIDFNTIVEHQETIIVVIKAIIAEDKPFINEKDIKLEIDDKWL